MQIKADVKSITKLKDYFFLVPDYQREYVWKVDDQVEQFLEDIDNEYEEGNKEQKSYFIGSIILVENAGKYDVIDGQQRLTTIVLFLCVFRDLLKKEPSLDKIQQQYFKAIEEWLSDFDMDTKETQVRLDLQYEESKGFLGKLIGGEPYLGEETASIKKMQQAYDCINQYLLSIKGNSLESLTEFAHYFLTKIELVLIESENLSSALKIFETINQRGAGLNAMDLVKNLLFSEAKESDFHKIKEKWKNINSNLQACREEDNPLRFLRYFLMARYHNGILREDDIYKWIISAEGKRITSYEAQPLELAGELEKMSKRYADLVNATQLMKDGGNYPSVTKIGFINKYRSRQHLILLMALRESCSKEIIEYLAQQLESFFFYSNTLGIQAKYNERLFSQWSVRLREVLNNDDLETVLNETIKPYLKERLGAFRQSFLTLKHTQYNPLYRQRYILGQIENTILKKSGLPEMGLDFFENLQIEHILPQTPKDDLLPAEFSDIDDYNNAVYSFGNVTLLESTINQAVNNFNNLLGDWFKDKQGEYVKSGVTSAALLNSDYSIGKNTMLNRFKADSKYLFVTWSKESISKRQQILMEQAFDTWLINGKRIDQQDL